MFAAYPPCSGGAFECDNGRCIPTGYVCDGDDDCGDSSDDNRQKCGENLISRLVTDETKMAAGGIFGKSAKMAAGRVFGKSSLLHLSLHGQ